MWNVETLLPLWSTNEKGEDVVSLLANEVKISWTKRNAHRLKAILSKRWKRPRTWQLTLLLLVSISVLAYLLVAVSGLRVADHFLPVLGLWSSEPNRPSAEEVDSYLSRLLSRQSQSIEEASSRYTLQSGRAPPPGFEEWFTIGRENKCLIDDYDQVHKDFEPFYRLAEAHPGYFKDMVQSETKRIEGSGGRYGLTNFEIRDRQSHHNDYFSTMYNPDWERTLQKLSHWAPDANLILNGRDEPRVVFDLTSLSSIPTATFEEFRASDPMPFDHTPSPTSPWFEQRGCVAHGTAKDSGINWYNHSGFMLNSASSQFTTGLYPVLSVAKVSPCFSDIIIPPPYYYQSSTHYGHFGYPNNVNWTDKASKLYWRGGGSGGKVTPDNVQRFPRFHLVDLSRQVNTSAFELIDARMVYFIDANCASDLGCDRQSIESAYVPFPERKDSREDVYRFKYLLDLDGNSFSGRYLGLLKSGSLIFKSTVFTEYVSEYLRPYIHYIPVKPDLSDLVSQVQWAIDNDEAAQRIKKAGKEMAELLTDEQHDCYFARVLLEWSRLQKMGDDQEGFTLDEPGQSVP